MTSREQQKEQRRKQIIFKALELFSTKGYSDTKIGDIAKAVDMSAGLMFHYFESKEQLYEELVRMGAQAAAMPQQMKYDSPVDYFTGFLSALFGYIKEQPWVFHMFVLMNQARTSGGIPQHIRDIALSVDQMEQSAKIIEAGQKEGYFREGDPYTLSFAFWSSVQGIMEQLAAFPEMIEKGQVPDTAWIVDILTGGKNA